MRVTPTNAGPDSKGIVSVLGWELEGMVAFYLVGGALVGMLVAFALTGRSVAFRLGFGVLPLLASAIWIKCFIHNRQPAFQFDVFERWLHGKSFRLEPQRWVRRRHPRISLIARLADKEGQHG